MMMSSFELPLAWVPLVDAVAKATVVLAMAAVASFVFRRGSAALRHLIWTLALCSALLMPVLSVALPKWQVPLIDLAPGAAPVAMQVEAEPLPTRPAPAVASTKAIEAAVATEPPAQRSSTTTLPIADRSAFREWVAAITWPQALLALWMAGAVLVFSRIAVGLVAVQWLARRTERVDDAPWLTLAHDLAEEIGISARLRFLRSGRASMPVAAGVFRPTLIMPSDADAWPETRLRIVLLHELAHVKRRDCLTHLLAQAACALYWFNPLAWIAAKRLRTERERACDDLVLAFGTRGSDYADQLLAIARGMQGDRFPGLLAGASLGMAHRSQLEGRLMAILDPKLPRVGVSRATGLAAVLLCCAAVAPLGAFQPWATTLDLVENEAANTAAPTASEPATLSAAVTAPSAAAGAETPQSRLPTPSPSPSPSPTPTPTPSVGSVHADVRVGEIAAEAAAEALAKVDFSEVVTHAIESGAGWNIGSQAQSAKPANPKLVAALTAALKDTDKDVREAALQALVQMRDPSIFEPLTQALKDGSPDVREKAAIGLGQMRDKRALGPLTAALKDEHAAVREHVVIALGQLRDPSSVDALAAALKDTNGDVREHAAIALGQIRDRRSVEGLISALKDSVADVREHAAIALGQIRDKAAVEPLIIALKDSNPDVREHVAIALGQIRDPRAIDALTELLKDPNADVRQQAAFALGQLIR
jgi:HEAT repeat protein/beta-lactamase regulating signal transducer with metallopeptidase domain